VLGPAGLAEREGLRLETVAFSFFWLKAPTSTQTSKNRRNTVQPPFGKSPMASNMATTNVPVPEPDFLAFRPMVSISRVF
jgi:hypothetical protein